MQIRSSHAAVLLPALLLLPAAHARVGEPAGAPAGDAGALAPSLEARARAGAIGASVGLQVAGAQAPYDLIGGARSYEARFDAAGVTFVPALGAAAPVEQTLRFEALALEQGDARVALAPVAPRAEDLVAVYDRAPGVRERYAVTHAGLEQSFVVDAPLGASGDLVVRGRLAGELAPLARPTADGGLRCANTYGAVRVGALTAIDAQGRTAAGALALAGGELALVVPAAFAERAAYPLVLDPLFGAELTVDASSWEDSNPDAAFDASTGRYLVVWKRTLSLTSVAIRAQRMTPAGTLDGGTIFLGSAGVASAPQVANANHASRFAVVWTEDQGGVSRAKLQLCDPLTGAISSIFTLASAEAGAISGADVGGEVLKDPYRQVVAVWDHDGIGIRSAHVDVPPTGNPGLLKVTTIAGDTIGVISHDRPRISRTAGTSGRYAVAYLRKFGLFETKWEARAVVIDRLGDVVMPSVDVTPDHEREIFVDVDGLHGHGPWVVASVQEDGLSRVLLATPLVAGATLSAGTPQVIVPFLLGTSCGIAARPGKVYLAWESPGFLQYVLNVRGVDPATCMTCEGDLTVGVHFPGTASPALCMNASGGNYDDPYGLVVWDQRGDPPSTEDADVSAHLLQAWGSSSATQNVGGGCGIGGDISAPYPPAVGNGFFHVALANADPLATTAILNLGLTTSPFACGPCTWTPFLITTTAPVLNGASSVSLPIACNPSYAGLQLDAQWNVLSPSATGCAMFPNGSLSDRLRITFGL